MKKVLVIGGQMPAGVADAIKAALNDAAMPLESGDPSSALDTQEGGDHYKKLGPYQPWEVAYAQLTAEELKGAMKFTVLSYLAREADKNGMEDIRKASHTMQIYLELEARREAEAGCGNCDGCSCSSDSLAESAAIRIDPADGLEIGLTTAGAYRRSHEGVAWLLNPWTGQKRDPRDIGSDPFGHLIAPF